MNYPLEPGTLVQITQGRYAQRTGVYVRPLNCGYFHIVDLDKGSRVLIARELFKVREVKKTDAPCR